MPLRNNTLHFTKHHFQMACIKKEREGHCEHNQCLYPNFSGLECVEIIDDFCENGADCSKECPYSYDRGSEKEKKAIETFKLFYPDIEDNKSE